MESYNLERLKETLEKEILDTAKSFSGKNMALYHGYMMGLTKAISVIEPRIQSALAMEAFEAKQKKEGAI